MFLTKKKKEKLMISSLQQVGHLISGQTLLPDALMAVARAADGFSPKRQGIWEKLFPSPACYLANDLRSLSSNVSDGKPLSRALRQQFILPEEMIARVRWGEQDGSLPAVLRDLGEDGQDEGEMQSTTIDAPIVKLVHGVLLRAVKDSRKRLCFPTLPAGIIATGEPAEGLEDPVEEVEELDPDTGRPVPYKNKTEFYSFANGQWRLEMSLPNKISGAVMNRILIMGNLRYWSRTPQEGTIRLIFPPGYEFPSGVDYSFRVKHDPAANRVELENITQAKP